MSSLTEAREDSSIGYIMERPEYKVPSLSQLHEQLIASKSGLKEVLDTIDFTSLEPANPFYTSVCGKNSIESVLEAIPSEEVLTSMVEQATK
jgi:hypothetical protein